MTSDSNTTERELTKPKVVTQRNASEAVYGLGMIGAWVYYIGHASTFWLGVLGFLKGIVWPAMLVFEALKYMH